MELSKEYFKVVDFEDTAVADFATLLHIEIILEVFSDFQFAGGKQLDIAAASVKIVSQTDTISEFKDRAVGFAVGRFAYGIAHRLSADLR